MTRSFRTVVVLVVVVALALGGGGWWLRQVVRDRSLPTASITVVVPRGATGHAVAALLARDRVIGSPLAFELLARWQREQSAMQAGEFRFSPHRTLEDVLHQLVTGGEQTAAWVTIPEGFTARQIAQTLSAARIGSVDGFASYFRRHSLEIDGGRTRSLEGYLFPDTYLLPLTTSPAAVAAIMTAQFRQELPRDAGARARRLGLSVAQVVTLASLVEREAKADDERPLIAGVYYNRLRRDMPLEVDATIEYVFSRHKTTITYADLAIDSPYNTYRHRGLPPTPIANPGGTSLHAAFFPQRSDFLYYVAMGNGHHAFSRTLAEHEANVARYLR